MKQNAIGRAKHFRNLTYKNRGINNTTAAKIYKMLCRPMLEYGALHLLKTKTRSSRNHLPKKKHQNKAFKQSSARSTEYLYEKLAIEPIKHRTMTKLKKRFAIKKSSFDKLNPLTLNFDIDGKEDNIN
jgi:hypothetical protein